MHAPLRRRDLDLARVVLAVCGLAAGIGLCGCAGTHDSKMFDRPAEPGDVAGRMIVTISDADMLGTAFATGQLAKPADAGRDSLTVIGLPIVGEQAAVGQCTVSNSVMGPPQALSVNSAATMAFVVESRGEAAPGTGGLQDLPAGTRLQAVSLADPMNPSLISWAYVGKNPSACDVSPDGALVAVATREARGQLVIVPVNGGQLGEPMAWELLGIDDSEATATSVSWDPSGKMLAVCLPQRDEVMFYEFGREGGGLAISPVGAPVKVGKFPYHGRWTPDGRYFITTDLQWQTGGNDYLLEAPAGTLSVIRVSTSKAGEGVHHQVVSTANVGVSPEGLAISPDGKYVVAANLKRSFLPEGDNRLESGSLTLLSLDADSGRLSPLGEYPLGGEHSRGGMPEGISFDAQGRFVVVTLFRSLDADVKDGELAFWRLNPRAGEAKAGALEQADFRVGVGRGPHGVLVVR
jgi:YD repeat-containing protein